MQIDGIIKNALERITEAAARLRDRQAAATVQEATEDEKKLMQEEAAFVTKFEESMDDDFNTADALAAVFELVKFANTNVQEGSSKEFTGHTLEVMTKLCDVLGLTLEKKEEILDEEIENLIAERQAARKAKDFARADEIRGLLLDKGIELKDTREGVKWETNLIQLKELFHLERPGSAELFSADTGIYRRWSL